MSHHVVARLRLHALLRGALTSCALLLASLAAALVVAPAANAGPSPTAPPAQLTLGPPEFEAPLIGLSAITINWHPTGSLPVVSYKLEVDGRELSLPGSARSYEITGLTPDTEYLVKLTARDGEGQQQATTEATYRTLLTNAATPTPAPTTPTPTPIGPDPTLTIGAPEFEAPLIGLNAITINWHPTGSLPVVSYKLEVDGRELSLPGSARSYEIAGLAPDTEYLVKLTARDGEGRQQATAQATYRTLPSGTPVPVMYTRSFTIGGTTTIPTLSKSAMPLTGTASFHEDWQGTIMGSQAELTLNDTQGRSTALGFLPVTATIGFAVSGGAVISKPPFTLTSKVRVKVKSVKAFGAIPLAGGNTCQTKQLSTIPLVAPEGFALSKGGAFAGGYAISNLNGCGLFGGLVSPLVAGSGNTMSLTLTRVP